MTCSKRWVIINVFLLLVVVAVGVGIYLTVKHSHDKSFSKGSRHIDTLKFLVVVTRHGNRAPLYGLPANDPYPFDNSTYWPLGNFRLSNYKDICPRFAALEAEVKAEFKIEWAQNITYFNDYTSKVLNTTVSGTLGVLSVWDALLSDEVEGFKLPGWAAEIFPEPMYPMMNDMYVQYVSRTDEMTRLTIGPFFAVMMNVLQSKINGSLSPDRSVYYWSGHDDTLIALQAVLGLPREDMVGIVTPGSALLYEIHQDPSSGDHFIEVLYINGTDPTLEPKLLPICDSVTPCGFDTFVENTAKFTNLTESKWEEICGF